MHIQSVGAQTIAIIKRDKKSEDPYKIEQPCDECKKCMVD